MSFLGTAASSSSAHDDSTVKRTDYRAFIVARYHEEGVLLLRAQKERKGVHFQLPGGHVDSNEISQYGLEEAQRVAAARELFEETGIDVR